MPTVADPPRKPLLIYDGDCGFCIFWITRWRRKVGDRLDLQPYHEATVRFPELPVESFRRAAQLVEPDGRVSAGAEAILRARALGARRGGDGWLWVYENVPGARALFDRAYRFVARNRPGLYKVTRLTFGEDAARRPLSSGTGAPRGPLALAGVAGVLAAGVLLLWLRRPRSKSSS
jgi:predicted DCC family thiol-disulfide oxidoreductase YuxK